MLDIQIALEFICTYPTPESAMVLTLDDFKAFAHRHGYTQPKRLPECFARLQMPRPQATPETLLVFRDEAVLLTTHLLHAVRSKNAALRELQVLFKQHPDHHIFDSLPGAGKFLAPALLVKFGDDRQRFQSGSADTRWIGLQEAFDPLTVFRSGADLISAGNLTQYEAAPAGFIFFLERC